MQSDTQRLENDLKQRLYLWEQNSFGVLTREATRRKAREVTAGSALLQVLGEEAFAAWVDRFYDEDIFYGSKPDSELPTPSKKRPLEVGADDPKREAKRGRTDPESIQDRELLVGLIRCAVCRKCLRAKDACYSRSNRPDSIVCFGCWKENEEGRFCAQCQCENAERPLPPLDITNVYSTLSRETVLYDCVHTWKGMRCRPCADKLLLLQSTRVVRLKRAKGQVVQDCEVYIGREVGRGGWQLARSPWFNPFKMPHGTKPTAEQTQNVLDSYEAYVRSKPELMARLPELYGKVLGCWCKPGPCHGDVLLRLIEEQLCPSPVKYI